MAGEALNARMGMLFLAAAFLVLNPTTGSAKYVATGPINGNVCSNYLFFEACHEVEIKAVRSTDGKLYTVGTEIEDVDEFHEDSSMCFVRVKRNNWYDSMKSWVGWVGYELGYNWMESFLTVDNNGDLRAG